MSDNIHVTIDTREVEDYLKRLGHENQLPYALSLAINNTLKKIQEEVRQALADKLTLRRVKWNMAAIKINKQDFATKTKLYGKIHISDIADNLARLATGTDHLPFKGKKYLSIPNSEVFGNKIINKTNPLKPSNLKLADTPRGTQGLLGTFLVEKKGTGTPLILQRTKKQGSKGKGKKGTNRQTGVRLLYTLVEKTKTPHKIDWTGIVSRVISAHLQEEIVKAMNHAIETAKAK